MRVLTVLVILVLAAIACIAATTVANNSGTSARSAGPAAPGVVPALGTPVFPPVAPVDAVPTFPPVSGDSAFPQPTLSAITAPGADAPVVTPVAVPTGVAAQLPTTGEWGLAPEMLRYLPGADRLTGPVPVPLPQEVPSIARLVIPSLGVDSPVVATVPQVGVALDGNLRLIWNIPNYAAGWHADSTAPGQAGNTVISGHNNVGSQVFAQLEETQIGAPIYLQVANGSTYLYTVHQVMVLPEDGQPESVRVANARYLQPTPDTRLTLISCWPDWTNTERVVVIALP